MIRFGVLNSKGLISEPLRTGWTSSDSIRAFWPLSNVIEVYAWDGLSVAVPIKISFAPVQIPFLTVYLEPMHVFMDMVRLSLEGVDRDL